MTHNVWNRDDNLPAWIEKGNDCSAAVRVKGHMRVWEETQPDIIGGQEFSRLMSELVKGEFEERGKNYALILYLNPKDIFLAPPLSHMH